MVVDTQIKIPLLMSVLELLFIDHKMPRMGNLTISKVWIIVTMKS